MRRFEKYKPNGIAVSDLSSQLWCEKQLDLKLTTDIEPEVTEEIRRGKEKHRKLEEELAEIVEVRPRTFEDLIFLELFRDLEHIIRLPEENIVREVPVFGELNGLFVRGVVDEIQLNDGVLEVHENKTRRKPTVPSESQLRCNRFQVMIYWRLLKDMKNGKFGYSKISDFYQLGPDDITDEFISELEEKVSVNLPTYELERMGELVFDGFTKLPQISERLTIRYIHQGTDKEIGKKEFDFNSSGFEDNIDFVSEYWTGERDAIPVGKKNKWKCNYCDYPSECPKYN